MSISSSDDFSLIEEHDAPETVLFDKTYKEKSPFTPYRWSAINSSGVETFSNFVSKVD